MENKKFIKKGRRVDSSYCSPLPKEILNQIKIDNAFKNAVKAVNQLYISPESK